MAGLFAQLGTHDPDTLVPDEHRVVGHPCHLALMKTPVPDCFRFITLPVAWPDECDHEGYDQMVDVFTEHLTTAGYTALDDWKNYYFGVEVTIEKADR